MPTLAPAVHRHFDLLDALDQAVIATDRAGRITHWNRSATTLYGWSAEEVIGRDIVDVTPSELARSQAEEIMRTLAAGSVWSGEFQVRGRTGGPFLASVTDVPITDDRGEVNGVVGLSAPSESPCDLVSVVHRLTSASNTVWPGRVTARIEVDGATVPASAPHMMQLLSLLLLGHGDALEEGTPIEVRVEPSKSSIFSDFGLYSGRPSVYLRIGHAQLRGTNSLLRSAIETAEPTKYVSALVRMVGGTLIRAAVPEGLTAWHLLVPISITR